MVEMEVSGAARSMGCRSVDAVVGGGGSLGVAYRMAAPARAAPSPNG